MMLRTIAWAAAVSLATLSAEGQTLLQEFAGTANGDLVGYDIAGGADFNQDGWDDLIIGVPGLAIGPIADVGAVRVVSGADGSVLFTSFGDGAQANYGWSVDVAGDVNFDGVEDIIVGAPNAELIGSGRPGMARVISGTDGSTIYTVYGQGDGDRFGTSVGGQLDHDGDSFADFAVGAPKAFSALWGDDRGAAYVYDGDTGAVVETYGTIWGPGSDYGHSMWSRSDVNGDGYNDLLIGAPNGGQFLGGEVIVISGDSFLLLSTVIDIEGFLPGDDLGWAVGAADVNGDGAAEVLVGSPGDSSVALNGGRVGAFDFVSETWLGFEYGAAGEFLGTSVAGLEDVDGDGLDDVAMGASGEPLGTPGYAKVFNSNGALLFRIDPTPGGDSFITQLCSAGDFNKDGAGDLAVGMPISSGTAGLVQVVSGGGPGIVTYCTAGISSSGCVAQIGAIGNPSATAATGFGLGATNVEGSKSGLFFYGTNGRQNNPWGNGTSFQCVTPPVNRGGLLDGGGTGGACDGQFFMDLNARWCPSCPKPNHNPGAGAVVQAQLWFRDPGNTSNQTTALSDAVEFVVQP